MKLGVIDFEVATTHFAVELDTLAEATGVDPNKYRYGLRQEQFSIPAADEDPVTLGATAASRLLERTGTDGIRTLLFATESGVDQSKSGAIFVQALLGLSSNLRVLEAKQACYGGTASLQAALGFVARNPGERVLVIMTDVARYAVDTPGEPTQGAGAVAMLVGADPQIFEVEPISGVWSADIDDFWRPNDLTTPLVDGELSLDAYLGALTGVWDDYRAQGGHDASAFSRHVHHQPFTKMSVKAFRRFVEHTGSNLSERALEPSLLYTPRIGNSHTASLYVGLASLLHHDQEDLSHKRVGLFSYGSGAAGEFLSILIEPGYRDRTSGERLTRELDSRELLNFTDYRALHRAHERGSRENFETPRVTRAPFRFAGVRGGARRYETN
jgi:hydroxymethylglutaryl-CoA synthase